MLLSTWMGSILLYYTIVKQGNHDNFYAHETVCVLPRKERILNAESNATNEYDLGGPWWNIEI